MPQIALHLANSLHEVNRAELAICVLCRAGLDCHTAVQSDMGAVLELLLDLEVEGEEDPSSDQEDKESASILLLQRCSSGTQVRAHPAGPGHDLGV